MSKDIIDFFNDEQNALFIMLATRNAELVPTIGRGLGLLVGSEINQLTVLVQRVMADVHLENLENNGKLSITAVQSPSHVSMQFKGDFLESRVANEAEMAQMDQLFIRMFNFLSKSGIQPESTSELLKFRHEDVVAITMEIKEIFDQTPRPGAGAKIIQPS